MAHNMSKSQINIIWTGVKMIIELLAVKRYLPILPSILLFVSCATYDSVKFQRELGIKLVDSSATKETVLLFHNLKQLSENKIIFGHQNSTEYGIGWVGDSLRSDVKDVTGSFPGVYGWDYESIPKNDTDKLFHRVPQLVKEAYSRGGINTFSWHVQNPITDNSFYDTTIAVKHILPGGDFHKKYLGLLDTLYEYNSQFKCKNGRPIPIIFRPFHEFDGHWFWWGKNYCTQEEFIQLWKMTVDYLTKQKKANNFLFAFSSDRNFWTEEDLLERYPGDDYVDIIGMDNYFDFLLSGDSVFFVQHKLKIISTFAEKRNKIAAFTETGLEKIPDSTWFTNMLYKMLDHDSVKIGYVMLWRNAHKEHFYVPFPGHQTEKDFLAFRRRPRILFEEDLPNLYKTIIMTDLIAKLNNKYVENQRH